MQETKFIVHLVMLDEDIRTAFATQDPEKADEALRLLANAFGLERASITRFGETTLDEYEAAVEQWTRVARAGPDSD
jgi:hypothetical protein